MPDEEVKLPKCQIVFGSKAEKVGTKLGRGAKTRITEFLEDRVAKSNNPRDLGAALADEWAGHWRYRVGDYRIICKIEDEIITILVIEIGPRREIDR